MDVAEAESMTVEERKFTVEEAQNAREAFMTAASTVVMPIVRIDGKSVANGAPGSVALKLRAKFHQIAELT